MVTRAAPQLLRWGDVADTDDVPSQSSDLDQSANMAPTRASFPLDFSAATNGPAVLNGVSTQATGTGLIINLIPDSSVASAPAGFVQAIQAAAAIYEQTFHDNITLNIDYGWGTFAGSVDP